MDPRPNAVTRGRGVVLAAVLGLGLALCAVAYAYSDDVINFLQSVARGKPGPAQVHIRY